MNDVIAKAIEASREREKKATPVVRWYAHPYERQVRGPWNRWFQATGPEDALAAEGGRLCHGSIKDDVEFAAGVMNNEPRFREALAAAVNKLEYLARQPHGEGATVCEGKKCFYKEYAEQTLPELAAILAGEEPS